MTSYFKRHPHRIIRAIRSIGSIALNATYFYVAQFLALVVTLSAIGGTNGAMFGQQIDISVLKSVNVIFLVCVACMIVAYILTFIWNTMGGRRRAAFPTGPVLGIGLVHLLRYAGVYTIYSTGKAAAFTALGLILIYLISRGLATFAEDKALDYMERGTVEVGGDSFTIYAHEGCREFTVVRSVEVTDYTCRSSPACIFDSQGRLSGTPAKIGEEHTPTREDADAQTTHPSGGQPGVARLTCIRCSAGARHWPIASIREDGGRQSGAAPRPDPARRQD